jgi:antitoxin component of MazEF toxin-antitoxin module
VIKRLTSLGNSAALIIDKPILELLHITPQTDLRISTDGRALTITPVGTALSDKAFKAAHEKVLKRHHNTFKKLANPDK